MAVPQAVLDFWFGRPGQPEYGQQRAEWFVKNPAFDARIRALFQPTVEAALDGSLADWAATPAGALALIVVLDQFPRNLFRGEARAFAGDPQARAVAREMVDAGLDRQLSPVQRVFAYLPFEHSEDMADQDRSVALFSAMAEATPGFEETLDYARRHREVIARFGRFPHRNAALGRTSTADEVAYLAQPGAGF
ncbi:MAG: DUF924 family protein [Betaproteobacteria bacterium]